MKGGCGRKKFISKNDTVQFFGFSFFLGQNEQYNIYITIMT